MLVRRRQAKSHLSITFNTPGTLKVPLHLCAFLLRSQYPTGQKSHSSGHWHMAYTIFCSTVLFEPVPLAPVTMARCRQRAPCLNFINFSFSTTAAGVPLVFHSAQSSALLHVSSTCTMCLLWHSLESASGGNPKDHESTIWWDVSMWWTCFLFDFFFTRDSDAVVLRCSHWRSFQRKQDFSAFQPGANLANFWSVNVVS